MLVIRYRRVGKKNYAQYKIVVAEKSFPIKGKFVEALGSFNPHTKETVLKEDRINYWLGVGAQCSDSVHNLLISKGLLKGEKRKINIKEKAKEEISSDEEKKEEVASPEDKTLKEEAPKEEVSEEKIETEEIKSEEDKSAKPAEEKKEVENKK